MVIHKNEVFIWGNAEYKILSKIGHVTFLVQKTIGKSIVKRRLRKRYLLSLIRYEKKRVKENGRP